MRTVTRYSRAMLVSVVLLALAATLAPATADAAPVRATAARSHIVRFNGIGKLKIGMTSSKLRKLGYRGSAGRYGCRFYGKDGGYSLIVSPKHRLISIDVYGNERTKAGIRIGSTVKQLERAYHHDHIEPHLDLSFGQGSNGILVRRHGRWLGFSLDDRTNRVSGIHIGIKRLDTDAEIYC